MTSPGETLSLSVPSTELNLQEEQTSQRLLDAVHDLGRSALHYVKTSRVVRGALALGLAVSAGTAGGVVTEMAELRPPAAVADTGGYPNADASCEPSSIIRDADGNYIRCNNYNWYVDENNNGAFNAGELDSPRGYGYRNCTDWVAWRVQNAGVGTVPGGWSHAKYWDDSGKGGSLADTTPEPGDIAVWNNGDYGHVAFVESTNEDGTVNISEYNKNRDGNYGTRSNVTADKYVDLNGAGKGLNGEAITPTPPPEPPVLPYDQNVKINADGRADLVTARAVGGFVVGYGAPNGTLTEGPLSLANWTVNSWAGAGDFNGDGHTDNLVTMPGGGFGVALGHANGVFTEGGVTLPGWGTGNWAGTGNFYKNGNDSRSDLVVARATGGFAVAYGMPNGTLTEGPISLPNWNVTSWAGTADLNGDNYTDILVAKPGGGFDLALGQPNGVFVEGGSTLPGWGTGSWSGTGNFMEESRQELVVARPQGGFAVTRSSANGTLTEGPVSLTNWTVPSWAGTGDFNGDGYTDILVAQPSGGFAIALGHANGVFTEGGVTLPGWGPGKWAGNGAFVNSKGYGYVRP